ncbi:hypothetical protein H0H93_015255 [Arthromyces matolae]|nr:hypothetical protein H0H93_015255 [Arthromyces matolae]
MKFPLALSIASSSILFALLTSATPIPSSSTDDANSPPKAGSQSSHDENRSNLISRISPRIPPPATSSQIHTPEPEATLQRRAESVDALKTKISQSSTELVTLENNMSRLKDKNAKVAKDQERTKLISSMLDCWLEIIDAYMLDLKPVQARTPHLVMDFKVSLSAAETEVHLYDNEKKETTRVYSRARKLRGKVLESKAWLNENGL